MREKVRIVRSLAIVGLLGLAVAGCSVTGTDSAGSGGMGSLEGTVMTGRGVPLAAIEVELWTDSGLGDTQTEYHTTTNAYGRYSFDDVELSSTEETCEIYVNRTRSDNSSINEIYGTYWQTVTMQKNDTVDLDLPIQELIPGDPQSMFDD
jgi:hypothetical protein